MNHLCDNDENFTILNPHESFSDEDYDAYREAKLQCGNFWDYVEESESDIDGIECEIPSRLII